VASRTTRAAPRDRDTAEWIHRLQKNSPVD